MITITEQIDSLAAETGVDAETVRHFAEGVARRVADGMTVREAVIDQQASIETMTERALQGADAWHADREHGSATATGEAYREFLLAILDKMRG